jgi:hypothetical protein
MSDDYSAYTVLLLHMEGSNGSVAFPDSSNTQRQVAVYGDAKISTAQSKWGSGSGYFDGSGDYLSTIHSAPAVGTGDFTMECWVYPTATTGYRTIISTRNPEDGCWLGLNSNTAYPVAFNNSTQLALSTVPVTYNAWNHLAIARSGTTLRIFVDGAQGVETTNSTNFASATVRIGITDANLLYPFGGYLQDVRITRGVARYTAPFTPPAAKLPDPDPVIVRQRHPRARRDMVYGGNGQFANPANDPITLDNAPYQARLRVFDDRTGHLVREAWSAADGTWTIPYLNRDRTYLVVCYDAAYPPLAYGGQTPDPMS